MAIGLRGCWSSISPIPDLRLADKKASEAAGGSRYKSIRNQPYFHSPLKIAYSRVPNNRVYAEIVALQQNSQQGWPVALRGRFPGRGSKKHSRPPLSTPLNFFFFVYTYTVIRDTREQVSKVIGLRYGKLCKFEKNCFLQFLQICLDFFYKKKKL